MTEEKFKKAIKSSIDVMQERIDRIEEHLKARESESCYIVIGGHQFPFLKEDAVIFLIQEELQLRLTKRKLQRKLNNL